LDLEKQFKLSKKDYQNNIVGLKKKSLKENINAKINKTALTKKAVGDDSWESL